MTYGRLPLFPPGCMPQNCLRVPLFGESDCCLRTECKTVRIQNPACPEEYADVELCVDAGGNLSICIKRPPKPCRPPCSRRHRPCWDYTPCR